MRNPRKVNRALRRARALGFLPTTASVVDKNTPQIYMPRVVYG